MKALSHKLILVLAIHFTTQILIAQISTFPYNQDFETFSSCIPIPCTTACPLPPVSQWVQDPLDAGDWVVDSAGTSSNSTGPDKDHKPGTTLGKYLYLESSGCNNVTINLLSPVFDLSVAGIFRMDFWYHMYGAMGTMHLDVSTNGGANWTNDVIPAWTDNINLWQSQSLHLGPYSGTPSVRFRIRGITGATFTSDMAIDDFSITEILDTNVVIASLQNEYTIVPLSQKDSIWNYMVKNIGGTTIQNLDIDWIMDNGINPPLIYTDTSYGPILPGDTLLLSPSNLPSFPGTFTITATAKTIPIDQDMSDNTDTMIHTLSRQVYSRDDNHPVYSYGIGGIPGHIGNQFSIYNAVGLLKGEVMLGNPTGSGAVPTVGSEFSIRLHNFNTNKGRPDSLLSETHKVTIISSSPNQLHTISFAQPFVMSPGEYVISIYEQPGNPNTAISACENNYVIDKHWIQFDTNPHALDSSGWSNITDPLPQQFHRTPVVRMILDDGCLLTAVGNPDTLCFGDSTLLGGNPTALLGTPPYSYSWSPAGSLNDPALSNPVATPLQTTTYTVTITDAFGCQDIDSVTIYVNPLPVTTIHGLTGSYCHDDPAVNIWATPATGIFSGPGITDNPGMYVASYSGSPVTILDGSGIYRSARTPVASLPGIQLGSDIKLDSVCFSISHAWVSDLNIRIENPAGVQVLVYDPILVCTRDNIDVCILPGRDFGTMSWVCDTFQLAIKGDYNAVPGQDLNSLNDGSNPNGTWKVSAADLRVGFIGTIDSADFYFSNSTAIFDPSLAGVGTHSISLCQTDINGCENCEVRQVVVEICTGISHEIPSFELNINPNPTNGSLDISIQSDKPLGNVLIEIFNSIGSKVYGSQFEVSNSLKKNIDLGHLSDGLYIITLSGENINKSQKLLKY